MSLALITLGKNLVQPVEDALVGAELVSHLAVFSRPLLGGDKLTKQVRISINLLTALTEEATQHGYTDWRQYQTLRLKGETS